MIPSKKRHNPCKLQVDGKRRYSTPYYSYTRNTSLPSSALQQHRPRHTLSLSCLFLFKISIGVTDFLFCSFQGSGKDRCPQWRSQKLKNRRMNKAAQQVPKAILKLQDCKYRESALTKLSTFLLEVLLLKILLSGFAFHVFVLRTLL